MNKFWSNMEWWLIAFGMICFAITEVMKHEWVGLATHVAIAIMAFELGMRAND